MLINSIKRFVVQPPSIWSVFQINKQNSFITSSSTKLTSSYYHHVSSLSFIYKTLGENFDETANKHPNDESYVFKTSANPDLPVAIFYTLGTTGHSKAATLTHFGIVNMSKGVTEHLEPYFTRLCTPIPIFHIFAEIVGVLNVATSKCQIVFPAIIT
ncbi:unnamed protein product [Rotaria sordida]|uniref:Medium-chain acyl-CoA ligase ACSF2, mitochondrial n=1 Tax=Rotaria sordida TaxID=392033 RepID=A0A814AU32_9BILA|nr:unnamed protein product [Rotaria sordida]CAF3932150.1 unnamed protein product [Rotaria sordida]